jgi:hypothetical protein
MLEHFSPEFRERHIEALTIIGIKDTFDASGMA